MSNETGSGKSQPMLPKFFLFGVVLAALAAVSLVMVASAPRASAQAPRSGERQGFQTLLLVPPDDRDYVVTKLPAGARAVVTDIIVYNVADGKGHKVAPSAESYLWLGGYVEGKSVGLANRLRVLGNETEQWHLQSGLELRGAPELVVSSEKGGANASPALVYVTGYLLP